MLATVVNQSADTAQVFFLIALICAAIFGIWALVQRDIPGLILGAALTFVAFGLLFFA